MPGLNIIYNPHGISEGKKAEIDRNLSIVCEKAGCKLKSVYSDANLIVSLISYYDSYPFHQYRNKNCHIFLEGFIFSHADGDPIRELLDLTDHISSNESVAYTKIGEFIKSVDGEFLVAIYDDKTGNLSVFNDILGRLPTYFCAKNGVDYVSREVKFITANVRELALSAHSIAQMLVFLFPLGDRTLLTDVKRLMPANLLRLNPDNYDIAPRILYKWDFSINKINEPAEAVVEELIELFLEGIKSRAKVFSGRKNILALSGGLDSRTVLGGLLKAEEPFTAITLIDHRGLLSSDLGVTKNLSATFDFDLNIFRLPGTNLDLMNKLVYMKDCLCVNAIMGTALYAHKIINDQYGNDIIYYTGAGGGLVLAPRCSIKPFNSNKLANHIIARNSQSLLENAADIMRIDSADLRDGMNRLFLDYPEEEAEDKYGHFMIFEHLFNFSFEGDDRQRYYFWNAAPFYSTHYFQKAMQISDKSKMNHRLFAEFLKKLDPRLAAIKYANWGFPITSPITPHYLRLKNLLLERPRMAAAYRKVKTYKQLFMAKGKVQIRDRDIDILKINIIKLVADRPELNDFIDGKKIIEMLPQLNNLYILYAVNSILIYIANLLEADYSLKLDHDK